jgi:hypothetical protein
MHALVRGLSIVLLVASAGLAGAAPLDPTKVSAVRTAANELSKLGMPSRQVGGQPPRISDPKVNALVDIVFDLRALTAAEPVPLSDLGGVNDWSKAIVEVGSVYIFAGTGVADPSKVESTPALAQQVEKNTVDYAPEMGRYFDAQLGVGRAILVMVNTHLAANPADAQKPNFKAGLPDIFGGVARTFVSGITTLPTAGLTDEWRKARLPALQALAPHVAGVLDADDLKTVHNLTIQVADGSTDAALKDGLRKIAAVFQPR